MRAIVFFDLPMITSEDKREYIRFRKFLLKDGFVMMQESVYCKLVLNNSALDSLAERIRKNKPLSGLVQVLSVTEKQYAKIDLIVGEYKSEVLDSDERLVIF